MSKQRVTILLDTGLIEYFKAKAGERGYQTLINDTLRQAKERETLEETFGGLFGKHYTMTPAQAVPNHPVSGRPTAPAFGRYVALSPFTET